ncbi:hypothetical protein ONR07_24780, partial [Salmonella enterica subsp. enterica serovar Anatum]|nr:hypothetical protein [Salmonella enterica subsp. enterica serovar Anatum]
AGIRPIRREIAVATRREVVINGFTAGFTKGVDHIQDATADTRTLDEMAQDTWHWQSRHPQGYPD